MLLSPKLTVSETATVYVKAAIGPSSVLATVEDGYAYWSCAHVSETEAGGSVLFTTLDGVVTGSDIEAGAVAFLGDGAGKFFAEKAVEKARYYEAVQLAKKE